MIDSSPTGGRPDQPHDVAPPASGEPWRTVAGEPFAAHRRRTHPRMPCGPISRSPQNATTSLPGSTRTPSLRPGGQPSPRGRPSGDITTLEDDLDAAIARGIRDTIPTRRPTRHRHPARIHRPAGGRGQEPPPDRSGGRRGSTRERRPRPTAGGDMTTDQARLVVDLPCRPRRRVSAHRCRHVRRRVRPRRPPPAVAGLLRDKERGVIAVYAPLFAGLDADLQRRLRCLGHPGRGGAARPGSESRPTRSGEPDSPRRLRARDRLPRHFRGRRIMTVSSTASGMRRSPPARYNE